MPANASFRDLVDVEGILCRLARDTHGALSLLGSASLEQLGGADIARQRIVERHNVWRAYVFEARQRLISPDESEAIMGMMDRLLGTLCELSTAYVDLVSAAALPPDAVAELQSRFPTTYRELQAALTELGNALGIDLSFPRRLNSLRRTCFERSLKWLDGELNRLENGGSGGNGSGDHPHRSC